MSYLILLALIWILKGWVQVQFMLYILLSVSLHQRAPVTIARHPVDVPHLAPQAGVLTPLLSNGLGGGGRGLFPIVI